jgi:hypothetical protein
MSAYGKATRKELRSTGLVVGTAFLVLGVLMWWRRGKVPPQVFYALGGVLLVLGLIAPALLRPFHFVWMKLAEGMGWVMNRVILGLVFFVFFTLTSLVIRLMRRDLLRRDFRVRAESYWVPRPETDVPPERYERQF